MTRAKKSAPSKRRTGSTRKTATSNRLARFLRASLVSGVAGFSIGTYYLNPQWEHPLQWSWPTSWQWPSSVEDVLAQLGRLLPGQQGRASIAPPVAAAGPSIQTQFSACPQFFPQQRGPVVPAMSGLRELCFSGFAVLHSGASKTPVFVAERLNRKLLNQAKGLERTDKFYADARLPRDERAELDDYRGSGYSRGHMAPAANMYNKETMAQSFSLANMVPQDQTHNGGPWSRVEQDTRKYVMRAAGDVYIFTGPVFTDDAKSIGDGVRVPSHLYKLVYDATTGKSWAHWQANHSSTKSGAPISYEELVKRTGVQFLAHTLRTSP